MSEAGNDSPIVLKCAPDCPNDGLPIVDVCLDFLGGSSSEGVPCLEGVLPQDRMDCLKVCIRKAVGDILRNSPIDLMTEGEHTFELPCVSVSISPYEGSTVPEEKPNIVVFPLNEESGLVITITPPATPDQTGGPSDSGSLLAAA